MKTIPPYLRKIPLVAIALTLGSVLLTAVAADGKWQLQPLDGKEAAAVERYLLPLPKEISFLGLLAPGDLAVTVEAEGGHPAVEEAAEALRGVFPAPGSGRKSLLIRGRLLGKDSSRVELEDQKRLEELPNSQQAYLIRPGGADELIVSALDPRGLSYGLTTLKDLVRGGLSLAAPGVPIVSVTDWPDMKERGAWNSDADGILPFLGSLKINFATTEPIWKHIVRDEPLQLELEPGVMERAERHAVNLVAHITHLNFWHQYSLFEAYPELAGQGDSAFQKHNGDAKHRVPRASNPLLAEILASAMRSVAEQGVKDASVWTSEYLSSCQADRDAGLITYPMGQFELEVKAILKAWEEVKTEFPDFQVRIFYSATQFTEWNTIEDIQKFLATIPMEVRIERCSYFQREREEPHDLILMPDLDPRKEQGGHLYSYMVPPSIETPRLKMLAYKDHYANLLRRGYEGGYAMQSVVDNDLNRELNSMVYYAIAEWAWNNAGRDARAFGEAWALRENLGDPEVIGEWADLALPIFFDIYGSLGAPDSPGWTSYISEEIPSIRKRAHSLLGYGFYRFYPDEFSFQDKLDRLYSALELAKKEKNPMLEAETEVGISYVRQSQAGNAIAELFCADEGSAPVQAEELETLLEQLDEAVEMRVAALEKVRATLSPDAAEEAGIDRQQKRARVQAETIRKRLEEAIR